MTGYRTADPGTARLAAADRWAWAQHAACQGESLNLFFGPDGERQPEREAREAKAKEICQGCPVRAECADYALARPEKYGVWSATTPEERVTIRRSRQRAGLLDNTGMCANGHPRTPENTRVDGSGHRRCQPCHRESKRQRAAA